MQASLHSNPSAALRPPPAACMYVASAPRVRAFSPVPPLPQPLLLPCSVYWGTMRRKLGLLVLEDAADRQLIEDLIQLMVSTGADWTRTWRRLVKVGMPSPSAAAAASAAPAGVAGAADAEAGTAPAASGPAAGCPNSGSGHGSSNDASSSYGVFLEEQLSDLADPAAMAEATRPR
jgi:hypothetical protein